ncbi:retron system putative HNH endonuclease [Bacillus sp. DJP31]|uniref:retron system putative HNH endonuclease n=1 Tax=Bacillus sp. DJP31 TaxID=3409789 RepID=UPI003BB4ADB1
MRKVNRLGKPDSLIQNANLWTRELLIEIRNKGSYTSVRDSVKNRYRQDDVRISLKEMYKEKCCYCETGIGTTSFEQIEHLKPKANPHFHQLAFEWSNLHWCCQRCNNAKLDKWNAKDPILDPSIDNPNEFLEFDLFSCEAIPKNGSLRGDTTIQHTNLNRELLLKSRERIRDQTLNIIGQLKKTPSQMDEKFYRELITNLIKEDAEYTMFMNQLIKEYL